jgi:glutaminyl-tRNA synthetase
VSANHAVPAEVHLYDHLFTMANPAEEENADFRELLNPKSLEVIENCFVEPSLAQAQPGSRYQFERLGYFCVDTDSTKGKLVFNRTVTLRDEWAKIEKGGKGTKG